jgi:hypothetical protein
MSQNEKNELQEVVRKVVITPEDVAGAAEFWPQFEVPMPSELKAAFDNFQKDPTLANQDELKYQLAKAVSTTDHDCFKDEMFKEITEECQGVTYEMNFNKTLEQQLTTEE